jgi:hypothetical protein
MYEYRCVRGRYLQENGEGERKRKIGHWQVVRLSLLTLYSTMKTNKTLAIFRHYVFTTFHNSNITSNNNLHTTHWQVVVPLCCTGTSGQGESLGESMGGRV